MSKKLLVEKIIKKKERLERLEREKLVKISAGSFMMGGNEDSDEMPIHEVTIDYDFMIGKYPVTFEQYDAFCEATGRSKPNDNGWGRGNRPVMHVSWNDAQEYCVWLSKETGEEFRLPSEAEWEYACRAGTSTKYSFGDDTDDLSKYAWYDNNSNSKTHPVGEKLPNSWGLHDMHGNVWEWCEDSWSDDYADTPRDGSAYIYDNSSSKILRGGSWNDSSDRLRSSNRSRVSAVISYCYVGFRVTRTLR